MATENFIPTVWSETLLQELEKEYIAVRNCNRAFEGEIRRCGDRVNILTVGKVSVFDYTKNSDMTALDGIDGTKTTLVVDRAKGFNFQLDDVDRAQAVPTLMTAAMREAAAALAAEADSYVFSLHTEASEENTVKRDGVNAENIIDLLLQARGTLLKSGVGSREIVLEVSPEVATILLKAMILTSSDNEEALEGGYLGSFLGFRVYVSNSIAKDGENYFKCFARTRRAIAYAEQLSEVEAYRPERRFADAVKGLHLYGAKVVLPQELVLLDLRPEGMEV